MLFFRVNLLALAFFIGCSSWGMEQKESKKFIGISQRWGQSSFSKNLGRCPTMEEKQKMIKIAQANAIKDSRPGYVEQSTKWENKFGACEALNPDCCFGVRSSAFFYEYD